MTLSLSPRSRLVSRRKELSRFAAAATTLVVQASCFGLHTAVLQLKEVQGSK